MKLAYNIPQYVYKANIYQNYQTFFQNFPKITLLSPSAGTTEFNHSTITFFTSFQKALQDIL